MIAFQASRAVDCGRLVESGERPLGGHWGRDVFHNRHHRRFWKPADESGVAGYRGRPIGGLRLARQRC
jgi:hypothetical protein